MVSLTATLFKGMVTNTKTFTLTVLAEEPTLGKHWEKVTNVAALDRYGHAVFAYHNELFVVGGRRGTDALKTVFGSTNDGLTWNSKANIDSVGYDLAASVFHRGSMYFMGGRPSITNDQLNTALYRSRPRNATNADGFALTSGTRALHWQRVLQETLSQFGRRYGTSAVSFQSNVWIMGGFQGNYTTDASRNNDVIRVDNDSGGGDRYWTNVPAMNHFSARNNHRSVTFADKIWVIGGHDGTNRLNDVWSSSDGSNWSMASGSFPAREGHSLVVLGGKMWIIGGYDGGTTFYNDVWSSSDGSSWTKVTDNADFSARYLHGAVAFKDRLWVIGGAIDRERYVMIGTVSTAPTATTTDDVWVSPPFSR